MIQLNPRHLIVSLDVLTRHLVISTGCGTFMFMVIVGIVYGYVWNFHN
jgi:branched-subunit amino acid transport protein AzlD